MKYHIPLRGGRAVKVSSKKVVKPSQGGAMHGYGMRGAGNLQKLKQALEKLQLKEKKFIKF